MVKTKNLGPVMYTFTSTVLSGEFRPVLKFVTSALEMTAFFSNPEPDWCWIDEKCIMRDTIGMQNPHF